jgi:hypothetical protein
MALSGSLLDFGFTDILQLVKMQRKSGRLTLTSREQSIALWFREGDLIYAKDDDRPMAAAVGGRLIQDGKVSQTEWQKVLGSQRAAGRPLAEFLPGVEPGLLAALAAAYLRETVFSVFRWVEGDYSFDADVPHPPGLDAIPLEPLDADDLLMEAANQTEAWRALDPDIPTWRLILAPEGEPVPEEADPDGMDAHLVALLDGHRDVRAVVEMSRYSALETCQVLATLKAAGRLKVVGESAPRTVRRTLTKARKIHTGRRAQAVRRSPFRAVLVGTACLAMMGLTGWLAFETSTGRRPVGTADVAASMVSYRDHQVRQALRVYYLTHGSYPEALDVLARDGLLKDRSVTRGLRYRRTADGFFLSSG